MTVTMVSIMSADGRGTKWNQPGTNDWASREDQDRFAQLKADYDVIVMGRKTWTAAKSFIRLSPSNPRVIVTRTPETYSSEAQTGILEFTSDTPAKLLARMKEQGRSRVLLVGGAQTNAEFLDADVVDEVITTVEPQIFGDGQPVVEARKLNIPLVLQSSETLNARGTLLLRYVVDRSLVTTQ
jgi:dihydrofolate reductase